MTTKELAGIFTEDPIEVANINGRRFILNSISLGNAVRIAAILDGVGQGLSHVYELGSGLLDACRIIAIACYNQKLLPPEEHSMFLLDNMSTQQITAAVSIIHSRLSLDKLFDHYKFKSSGEVTSYPGSHSPWSTVLNRAIAMKGWNEADLKWNISMQNLMMYALCIPQNEEVCKSNPLSFVRYENDKGFVLFPI